MLYELLNKYMMTHSVNDVREYLIFIEKEIYFKINKLTLIKYISILLILSIGYVTYMELHKDIKDVILLSTYIVMLIINVILISWLNSRLHRLKNIISLTKDMTCKVPSLNFSIIHDKNIKNKLLIVLSAYLTTLSVYLNIPANETLMQFENQHIHSLF